MSPKLIEHIEMYLSGQMSKNDLLGQYADEFDEKEIDGFIEWVKSCQLAIEARGLRNELKSLSDTEAHRTHREDSRKILGRRRGWLLLLLSALLILLMYFLISQTKEENNPVYIAFRDPGLPVKMGESSRYQLDDAMTYFKEANFEVAETKFALLLNQQPGNDTLQYYHAASQLYDGQVSEAIEHLEAVANSDTSQFKQRAQFLLANAYYLEGQSEQAQNLLKLILSIPNHEFAEQAEALLSKM